VPLQATDPDGDTLAFSVITPPQHGSLSGVAPNLVYIPAPDFSGADAFGYRIDDGHGGLASGTVAIAVNPDAVPIDKTNSSVSTRENASIPVPLQATDADGDTLAFSVITPPQHGSLSGVAPNLVYIPAPDFSGADAFDYRIDDGHGGVVRGTLTITARPDAAPIDQTANSLSTQQNVAIPVSLHATDPEADTLAFSVITPPQHGSLSGVAPNLVYTPATNYYGADAFRYRIDDGHGGVVNGVAAITVRDVTPPQVVDLKVRWGTKGIASILNSTRVLPWQGINAIEIVFSEDVAVTQASLTLTGVNVARYATSFRYDTATHTARWKLRKPTAIDRVALLLAGQGSSAVKDPSGNRLAGGVDYQRSLRILPGDFTGDGHVNAADLAWVRNHVRNFGGPNPPGDVDGNGRANQADLKIVRKRFGTHLPSMPVRVSRSASHHAAT
jgi:hypothetical protein